MFERDVVNKIIKLTKETIMKNMSGGMKVLDDSPVDERRPLTSVVFS